MVKYMSVWTGIFTKWSNFRQKFERLVKNLLSLLYQMIREMMI